jgi:sulfoxide reductase heme-binding subunit YedZ
MLLATAAVHGSSPIALWYLTRATGVVTLVLLTLTVALGVANVQRWHSTRIPRFVVNGVHRNASLLAVAFLGVHVVTTLLDTYTSISLTAVLVPFAGTYRPVWLGLGALSLDLLVAVMVTSLLRKRFGYRAWRAVHWLAYASWPVALLHSIGTGSDAGRPWMLAITGGCLLTVGLAVWSRLAAAKHPPQPPLEPARRPQARGRRAPASRLAPTA